MRVRACLDTFQARSGWVAVAFGLAFAGQCQARGGRARQITGCRKAPHRCTLCQPPGILVLVGEG